ncbi:spore germination protein [Paenibacillus sp. GSMTC-2017]|uniref:spore germination protein n=1 Tax=Paenibacillus sp. GSMTC-2017 TaxID=2794350 RepID=UPI0018D7509A|nr:spore germination protein [Paenibacillus sp. GSMTC-2017]MBH5317219.1 spore germination protein [Paenibacillus sp. GSMTC-2017]
MNERIQLLFADATDLKTYTLKNSEMTIEMAYIAPLCDEKMISDFITVPFIKEEVSFRTHLNTNPQYVTVEDPARWQDLILRGNVLIENDGVIYSLYTGDVICNQSPQTQVESAIQGPQLALSEDLNKSINLIRSMYPAAELAIEEHTVGYVSKTPLLVVFDQRLVDPSVLDNVRSKLSEISVDMVQAAGELEKLIIGKKRHLFPTVLITERPDRITRAIAKGKVVVLIKGSMFALIMPAVFFDFMHAVEDNYEAYWMTRFLIFIRYSALILTVTLPALYIAVVSYNPELFRIQLAFSIGASRSAVPYPSFIEVFIMLFMIETLIEASTRLPRYIGSTATTVGGLILGQAAQQAGLVSTIMIIVTSVVAISNFVIPINSLSFAVRFLKYPLIAVSIFFGITGVAIGLFIYLAYLCNLRSFGKPYFRLHGEINPAEGDIGQVRAK